MVEQATVNPVPLRQVACTVCCLSMCRTGTLEHTAPAGAAVNRCLPATTSFRHHSYAPGPCGKPASGARAWARRSWGTGGSGLAASSMASPGPAPEEVCGGGIPPFEGALWEAAHALVAKRRVSPACCSAPQPAHGPSATQAVAAQPSSSSWRALLAATCDHVRTFSGL